MGLSALQAHQKNYIMCKDNFQSYVKSTILRCILEVFIMFILSLDVQVISKNRLSTI